MEYLFMAQPACPGLPDSQHPSEVQPGQSKIVPQRKDIKIAMLGLLSIISLPKWLILIPQCQEHKKQGTCNVLLLLLSSISATVVLGLLRLTTSTGAIHPKWIETLFVSQVHSWPLQYPVAMCSKI